MVEVDGVVRTAAGSTLPAAGRPSGVKRRDNPDPNPNPNPDFRTGPISHTGPVPGGCHGGLTDCQGKADFICGTDAEPAARPADRPTRPVVHTG